MTSLNNAPLLEAIFELRWGHTSIAEDKSLRMSFTDEDTNFFFGQFNKVAHDAGFGYLEKPLSNFKGPIPHPHQVAHRYRKAPNAWPCYQIGLGIFATNQVNDGYDWPTFKDAIINGLNLLDNGHPLSLASLPLIGVELRYQDAFLYSGDDDIAFFDAKMNFGMSLPEDLVSDPRLGSDVIIPELSFNLNVSEPSGTLFLSTKKATINGEKGFLMETTIRSVDNLKPELTIDALSIWLDKAHSIQKLAFDSLINPAFMRTFK
jgi:uncharacterized protein (TIGR04255 family)